MVCIPCLVPTCTPESCCSSGFTRTLCTPAVASQFGYAMYVVNRGVPIHIFGDGRDQQPPSPSTQRELVSPLFTSIGNGFVHVFRILNVLHHYPCISISRMGILNLISFTPLSEASVGWSKRCGITHSSSPRPLRGFTRLSTTILRTRTVSAQEKDVRSG
jgi:hypothetical protein